jgi:hypothetical protein
MTCRNLAQVSLNNQHTKELTMKKQFNKNGIRILKPTSIAGALKKTHQMVQKAARHSDRTLVGKD